ncbi:MAG TPA: heavy metal-binding domain-containing protein [Actinophytocola sp.]|nr:heavy metal-binding domain-containing protein [Actinophytocola sp.]
MRRAAENGVWTSLLSVPAAAGLRVAGLEPAGEVMGSMVAQLSLAGASCGVYGPGLGGLLGGPGFVATGSTGFGAYAEAVNRGYATALARLTREATGIGADGVVGIALTTAPIGGGVVEFTALGTAVRAAGPVRPGRVFTTALPGQDVAKLMVAGWMPAALVLGVAVAVRHDDWQSRQQASWGAGNTEVAGYTQLLNHTRADARARFTSHVRKTGADGAIVSSMALRMWSIEPSENHRDHVAEATVFGTAIARFAPTATATAARSLTILPLQHTQPGSTS